MKARIKTNRGYEDNEYVYRDKMADGAINHELCDRVDYICDDTMLRDETFRYKEEEMPHLSEAYRIAMNMDKKELAVFLCACIDKYPYLVYQALAEGHEALTNRRR